jgi:hypothetical protein
MKGKTLAQGEIMAKKSKYTLQFLKNLLQNQQANFNQTWYKSSLGKGDYNCSNKGPGPLQRGDNYKIAKMGEVI